MFAGLTVEQRREQYVKDREVAQRARRTQVDFLGSGFKLRMGVTVLGGGTGRGKSTAVANVLHSFCLAQPNKTALVISNEETSAAVLDRVSCLNLGLDFYRYSDGFLGLEKDEQIQAESLRLAQQVEVVSSLEVDTTCLDDVCAVLTGLKKRPEVGIVLLDYLQTITHSNKYPDDTRYEVSKKFGLFLKKFGTIVTVPVLVFAQTYPDPEQKVEFESRVQGDKTFLNHAVAAVEIVPDLEQRTTTFVVHKDRFGDKQGKQYVYDYKAGKLTLAEGF